MSCRPSSMSSGTPSSWCPRETGARSRGISPRGILVPRLLVPVHSIGMTYGAIPALMSSQDLEACYQQAHSSSIWSVRPSPPACGQGCEERGRSLEECTSSGSSLGAPYSSPSPRLPRLGFLGVDPSLTTDPGSLGTGLMPNQLSTPGRLANRG